MKQIKTLALLAVAALSFSCKPNGPAKLEPQAPVISEVSLRSVDGAAEVACEEPEVKFSAKVEVTGSTLDTYVLTIKKDAEVIASSEGSLEGESLVFEKSLSLLVTPQTISEDFFPVVTFKVTSKDGDFTEYTLKQEETVKVLKPKEFEKLFLLDGSKVIDMLKTDVKGVFRTSASLEGLGEQLTVATAVDGNKVAAKAQSWNFAKPATDEFALLWLAFDLNTQKLSKLVDYVFTVDCNAMAQDAAKDIKGNPYKVVWSAKLVQDGKVEFLNFPSGLILSGDRFADVDGNTARYTAETRPNFELYYIPEANFFTTKYQWNDSKPFVVLTGANCSAAIGESFASDYPVNWFLMNGNGHYATTTIALVAESESTFRALMYLKENFEFKLYSKYAWADEISPLTSATPDLLTVTPIEEIDGKIDGNYALKGDAFTEGLYMLRYNVETAKLSLEKFYGVIPVIK